MCPAAAKSIKAWPGSTQLWAYLERQIPNMYHKAYRWVAEMEEIGDHLGATTPGAREIYHGMARLYEALDAERIAALDAFLER